MLLTFCAPTSLKTASVILVFFITYFLFGAYVSRQNWRALGFIQPNDHWRFYQPSSRVRLLSYLIFTVNTVVLIGLYVKFGRGSENEFRFTINRLLGGTTVLAMNIFSLIAVMVSISDFLQKRTPLPVFFCILGSMIISSLTGSRFQMLVYLFPLMGIWYIHHKFNNIKLILSLAVIAIAAIAMRVYTMLQDAAAFKWAIESGVFDGDSILNTISIGAQHTIQDISYRTDMIISSVPRLFPHTQGESLFFHFLTVLPGEQQSPSIKLNHLLFGGSDTDVGYPPTLVAQLYLDFGLIGTILGGCFLGAFGSYLSVAKNKSGLISNIYILYIFFLLVSCYGEFLLFHFLVYSSAIAITHRYRFTLQWHP